ncbi:MerR family transcriptional regulator [Actinoplanes sp. RD1]|uniref:MerR family transcriptional regulator n=1 Tax=Actinoplanes sp. RD1 TaxID=3064538 RepID=UPI0027426A43|nr:MerR family transcriptional regulator [Actinoplanes sp. RD1]
MELLTIGAFARAARLSPKALRLYDELGLLRPAAVDADSGYRFYDPAQLDRARLVAWMRRLGLPLARIRELAELPGAEAAEAITAWMAQAEAELAARGRLAGFLVDYLTGRGAPMSDTSAALGLRFAAGTAQGRVRDTHQDHAYAGSTLLAVADGGGPHGDRAAAAAVAAFRDLAPELAPLEALDQGVRAADAAVRALPPGDDGAPFTTLTALVWSGSRIGVAHIGDSRAYLLRGGELSRFTDDHSYVQQLVDAGELPAAQALAHPQRPLLVRALGASGEADVSLRTALPGDRYLLCTDGLWATVPGLAELLTGTDPRATVDRLLAAADDAGAPDNVACVVADVVPV